MRFSSKRCLVLALALAGIALPLAARSDAADSAKLPKCLASACVYSEPNFKGKEIEPQEGPEPQCIKFAARSIISQFGSGGMVGGPPSQFHVEIFDNPDCNGRSPHRKQDLPADRSEPDLKFPGRSGMPMSLKLVYALVTNP